MRAQRGMARRRAARRRAWATALAAAPPPEALAIDPLAGPRRITAADVAVLAPILVCAAIGAHVVFVGIIWGAGNVLGGDSERAPESETIQVAVIDPPPAPEPELTSEDDGASEAETVEPENEPEPRKEPEAPPPEPQDAPPEEPPETAEDPQPPEKITGLDIGSTVEGGSGPNFATGNTRRGSTDRVARDPGASSGGEPGRSGQGRNRRATRIPQAGAELVKPERVEPVEPTYPPKLKAQGIEGNVLVEVRLDEAGRVVDARIIEPAPHEKMNQEALAAARSERFRPATRDGEAIEYTLTYTVRFRLSDS